MHTRLIDDPEEAAALVRRGGIVAFPTETVYGLGADARDARALARVFEAKGRPSDNPLIVHVADPAGIDDVAARVPDVARRLLAAFAPGPLTLVVPRAPGLPDALTAGLDTVGVRIPDHALARAFLRACGRPVAAPSANRSGRPSPTTWEAVRDDLDGRIDGILRGEATQVGLESTVLDVTVDPPVVLRAGGVTLEALRGVEPGIAMLDGDARLAARSPGTRYRHYAPRARVALVDAPPERPPAACAYIGRREVPAPEAYVLAERVNGLEDYARRLFDFFRRADRAGAAVILCERVEETGIGRALADRLRRAADG